MKKFKKKKVVRVNGFRIQPKLVYEAFALNGNGAGVYEITEAKAISWAKKYNWHDGSV